MKQVNRTQREEQERQIFINTLKTRAIGITLSLLSLLFINVLSRYLIYSHESACILNTLLGVPFGIAIMLCVSAINNKAKKPKRYKIDNLHYVIFVLIDISAVAIFIFATIILQHGFNFPMALYHSVANVGGIVLGYIGTKQHLLVQHGLDMLELMEERQNSSHLNRK